MASNIGVRIFCLGWLLTQAALASATFVTYTPQGRPYCNSAKSDPDGDGFGWENRKTCVVRGGRVDPAKDQPACQQPPVAGVSNDDADSWDSVDAILAGIGQSVEQQAYTAVPSTDTAKFTPGGTPYCTPAAIDPDEDGFGWENSRTCIVRYSSKDSARGTVRGCTIQVTTLPYCTQEQKGWGFEQGRACVAFTYCPANRSAETFAGRKFKNILMQSRARPSARAVYDFLRSIHGHYTISGQMDKIEIDSFDMAQRVFDETGKRPALMGYDFMNYTRFEKTSSVPGGRKQVEEAIAHWQRGGLVSFLWHWRDPLRRNDHFYTHSTTAKIPLDRSGRLDRRDPMMKAIDSDIAAVAKALQKLRDAEVAVLWRPLHEASGGWFWWGRARTDGIPPAYAQVVLWRYLYTELTQRYGLDNLIWVWNGQHAGWYPGDEYVDIVSYDSYPEKDKDSSQIKLYQATAKMSVFPKMVAMSENGNIPDPDFLDADNAHWIWFMTWNDFHPVGTTKKTNFWSGEYHNSYEHKRHVYNHPRVLTLDDLQEVDFSAAAKN